MCSREECDRAFRYIGYDHFRYDIDDDDFKNKLKSCQKPTNHIDYINAIRSYAIYNNEESLEKREHLVKTYFDKQ